jgi:hypothetical protein
MKDGYLMGTLKQNKNILQSREQNIAKHTESFQKVILYASYVNVIVSRGE